MHRENSEQLGLQRNVRRKLNEKVRLRSTFLGSLNGKASDLISRKWWKDGKELFYFSLGENGQFRLTSQKCHMQ